VLVRIERIGFDNDYDRAIVGLNRVRFVAVKNGAHAGVDVDSDLGLRRGDSETAVDTEERGGVSERWRSNPGV
jgi:hypothetical protein